MPARDESRKGNDLGAELCVGIPGQGRHGHDAEVLGVLGEHLDYDDKSLAGKHVGPVSVRWVRFPVEAAVAQATGSMSVSSCPTRARSAGEASSENHH